MKFSVNETVINPNYTETPSDFLADIFDPAPKTLTIIGIVERDMSTDEQGYTRRVESSDQPDAIVEFGNFLTYRLSELTKA